jgi:hypothetical protein
MRRAVSVLVVGSVSLLARPCSPNREVSVSALVEEGDRVLAHAHRAGDEEIGPPERFLVAEVHDGQNTGLLRPEPEAHLALHAGAAPDASSDSDDVRPRASRTRRPRRDGPGSGRPTPPRRTPT